MKKENGITLIALILTIIVLIILTGISINALNNNGILGKAKEARDRWKNAQNEEEMQIAKYSNEIDSYVDGDRNNTIETKTVTTSKGSYIFTKNGNVVHCSFFDDGIDISDYKNNTVGILLETLPYPLDISKYALTITNGNVDFYTLNSTIFADNTNNKVLLRILDSGKLQIYNQQTGNTNTDRTISGAFCYFTTN